MVTYYFMKLALLSWGINKINSILTTQANPNEQKIYYFCLGFFFHPELSKDIKEFLKRAGSSKARRQEHWSFRLAVASVATQGVPVDRTWFYSLSIFVHQHSEVLTGPDV